MGIIEFLKVLECGHVIVLLKGLLPLLKGAVGRRIIRIDEKSIPIQVKEFCFKFDSYNVFRGIHWDTGNPVLEAFVDPNTYSA